MDKMFEVFSRNIHLQVESSVFLANQEGLPDCGKCMITKGDFGPFCRLQESSPDTRILGHLNSVRLMETINEIAL
jgi:hypothetical protein